jgi:hypothetical protein
MGGWVAAAIIAVVIDKSRSCSCSCNYSPYVTARDKANNLAAVRLTDINRLNGLVNTLTA